MSDEVIFLSSDENELFNKRKGSDVNNDNSNVNLKKHKIAKCSSPQPGCSKHFDRFENKAIKPQLIVKTKITIPDAREDVFQNFITTCLEKRDDADTRKVLRKLEKLYNKLSPLHKSNDELRLFISSCHEKITKGLSNDIYTPVLDLHTELKSKVISSDTEQDNVEEIEVSKEDMKKIKLLEKSIQACLKKIKELEEKEVDFDEDNDSAYIQEDKYKKRLIQLCNMLSNVSGDKMIRKQILKKKIRRKDIPDEITGITSVDEAILKFINSDIGKINQLKYLETQRCADHIKMPEYLDILKCIEKCNKDSNLGLSKEKTNKLAKQAFQAVGNFLKKKRMDETSYYIQSFLSNENEDPAKKDVALHKKLQENKKEGDRKLEEIFKKYCDEEEGLHKEDVAEESENESKIDDTEDEDMDEDVSSCLEEESNDEKLKSSSDKEAIIKKETKINDESIDNNNKSENRIINEEYTNFVDDDVLVINDTWDDNIGAKDSLDINNKMTNGSSTEMKKDSCDVSTKKVIAAKSSFIKVCAFARPPPAWGELSPEKLKPKSKLPIQQALQDLPKPECVDLTEEREKRPPSLRKPTSSTRSINPLANIKCSIPAKRVVIVNNVINNYNVPFRSSSSISNKNVPNKRDSLRGQATWLSKDKGYK